MTIRVATVLVGVASLLAGLVIPVGSAQQVSGPVKVIQVTGLAGVKDTAKGTLNVENGRLRFHGKASSEVSAASIQDVVTGADSQRAVGGNDWHDEHGRALRRGPGPEFIPHKNRHTHRPVSRC